MTISKAGALNEIYYYGEGLGAIKSTYSWQFYVEADGQLGIIVKCHSPVPDYSYSAKLLYLHLPGMDWDKRIPITLDGVIRGIPMTQTGVPDGLLDELEQMLRDLGGLKLPLEELLNTLTHLPSIPTWNPGLVWDGILNPAIPQNPSIPDEKTETLDPAEPVPSSIPSSIPIAPAIPLDPDKTIEQTKTPQIWDRFPFCLPYDLINLIKKLNATGEAPKWEIPFDFSKTKLKYNYTFTLDLAPYEPVAKTVRTLMTIFFIGGLVLITRNMIRG